jgi:hypothetical protein
MKPKTSKLQLLYYGLIGASVSLIGATITKLEKATPQQEAGRIFISLLCVIITHIIWYKYIRKSGVENTKNNLAGLVGMWVGISIGVGVTLLLKIS